MFNLCFLIFVSLKSFCLYSVLRHYNTSQMSSEDVGRFQFSVAHPLTQPLHTTYVLQYNLKTIPFEITLRIVSANYQ